MDDIKGRLIGGAIVLVIGGTGFAVSQTDIIDNFANETGMTHEQAKQYVEDSEGELDSFKNVGADHIESGNSVTEAAEAIDCQTYQYDWQPSTLSCQNGKDFIRQLGRNEVTLGQCYEKLDEDLGDRAASQINQCISDIDFLNDTYSHPIAEEIFGADIDIEETINSNLFNKSVLKAALES